MKYCAAAIILALPGCASVPTAAEVHDTLSVVLAKAQLVAKVCDAPVPDALVKPCADVQAALVVAPQGVAAVDALAAAVEALAAVGK